MGCAPVVPPLAMPARTKRVLGLARREADALGHTYIGTDHPCSPWRASVRVAAHLSQSSASVPPASAPSSSRLGGVAIPERLGGARDAAAVSWEGTLATDERDRLSF